MSAQTGATQTLNPPPGRLAAALVALVMLLAALPGVFTMPPLDRDESRFAQASAQMLETGDFVRIRYLDEGRHKKPVGIHWAQAASVAALSSEDARQIWAYRIPSVIGAVIAALATFWIGTALIGRTAGFAAGLLIASSVLLGAESGIGKTDAMLAGLLTMALLCLVRLRMAAEAPQTGRKKAWAVTMWVFIGLGALVKGPVAPVALGLTAGALIAWEAVVRIRGGEKSWPALWGSARWLRPALFWPGPVLAGLIVLPWLVAVQIATEGGFLREALGEDLGPKLVTGDEGHGGPPGYHVLALPLAFFPAALFLPAGIAAAIRALKSGGEAAIAARLAFAAALPIWILFEILPTKLPHYVLPAYPGLAILAGWGLAVWPDTSRRWRMTGAILTGIGAVVWAGGLTTLAGLFDGPMITTVGVALALLAAAGAAILAGLQGRAGRALACAVAAGLVFQIGGRGIVAPMLDLSPARDIVAAIEDRDLRPEGVTVLSTYTEPSLAFLLGGDVILTEATELPGLIGDYGEDRLVIIDWSRIGADPGGVEAAAIAQRIDEASCAEGGIQSYNYSRGRRTTLSAHRLGDCQNGDEG